MEGGALGPLGSRGSFSSFSSFAVATTRAYNSKTRTDN